MKITRRQKAKKPTTLFKSYVAQLVFRTILFAWAIHLLINDPAHLSMSTYFGVAGGFNFVDLVFLSIVLDFGTKFFPNAKISMGSLKQYGEFHIPTPALVKAGYGHVVASVREVLRHSRIVADRYREVAPVIIFWIVLNLAVGGALSAFDVLNEATIMLWVLFYFVFDMICVVLWCPLQLLLMRNRCCTTCQIFNWDAIMTVTPLFALMLQPATAWFTYPLIILALIVLLRWEISFARHPERFDERTNASLSCRQCTDKLCYIRKPLEVSLSRISDLPTFSKQERNDSCSD